MGGVRLRNAISLSLLEVLAIGGAFMRGEAGLKKSKFKSKPPPPSQQTKLAKQSEATQSKQQSRPLSAY